MAVVCLVWPVQMTPITCTLPPTFHPIDLNHGGGTDQPEDFRLHLWKLEPCVTWE